MTKNYIKFKNRIIFIHIAIMLVWIGFGFRLFNIQIINKLNSPQGIKVETVKGLRGNFFDINGRNLTQNLTFYRIGIHSKKIINKDNFLNELSACTGTEKELQSDEISSKVKKIVADHLGIDEAKGMEESSIIDDLGAESHDTVEVVMHQSCLVI